MDEVFPPTIPAGSRHSWRRSQVETSTGTRPSPEASRLPWASVNWLGAQLSGEHAAARAAPGSSSGDRGEDEDAGASWWNTRQGPDEVPGCMDLMSTFPS